MTFNNHISVITCIIFVVSLTFALIVKFSSVKNELILEDFSEKMSKPGVVFDFWGVVKCDTSESLEGSVYLQFGRSSRLCEDTNAL